MDTQRSGLARLSSFQIALLAVLTSTIAAVSVLFGVRLLLGGRGTPAAESESIPGADTGFDTVQPAVDTEMTTGVPHHFTEDLIIPGFTETGQDVLRDDDTEGRSPEGV